MKKDTGLVLTKLLVDGAMTNNNLLMQMQADICGIPVGRREEHFFKYIHTIKLKVNGLYK